MTTSISIKLQKLVYDASLRVCLSGYENTNAEAVLLNGFQWREAVWAVYRGDWLTDLRIDRRSDPGRGALYGCPVAAK